MEELEDEQEQSIKSQQKKDSDEEEMSKDEDSESEERSGNNLDLKYWKSSLIRDGLGPFLNPAKLREKVSQ